MTPFVVGLLTGIAGTVLVVRLAARRTRSRFASGVGPHLLPDPALGWLVRVHGALGIWISEYDREEDAPRTERIIESEQLGVAQIAAVDRRLEQARDHEQSGVERLESGTLVVQAGGGAAVGLLLPMQHRPGLLEAVEADLRRLLDGVHRRPQIVALAQAQAQETSLESVGSVGLRLAYQLERLTGDEVVVAAKDPSGVRVVGVSGRADRRLLDAVLPADSPLVQVIEGRLGRSAISGDPLGGVVPDRRSRDHRVLLIPLVTDRIIGAVALWLPAAGEPAGAVAAELDAAISSAAPRLDKALQSEALADAAIRDPLTGLLNRRGLDQVLHQQGLAAGALIYADLDRFKLLNDTLGHPAGDAALVHFGRLIRDQVRSADTAARIGGEEFAIWLPDATLEVGVRIAERIRIKLGTTAWDWQGRHWPLSASFGVAALPETSGRAENLPAQADAALYVAKKGGRNRVEAAGGRAGRR